MSLDQQGLGDALRGSLQQIATPGVTSEAYISDEEQKVYSNSVAFKPIQLVGGATSGAKMTIAQFIKSPDFANPEVKAIIIPEYKLENNVTVPALTLTQKQMTNYSDISSLEKQISDYKNNINNIRIEGGSDGNSAPLSPETQSNNDWINSSTRQQDEKTLSQLTENINSYKKYANDTQNRSSDNDVFLVDNFNIIGNGTNARNARLVDAKLNGEEGNDIYKEKLIVKKFLDVNGQRINTFLNTDSSGSISFVNDKQILNTLESDDKYKSVVDSIKSGDSVPDSIRKLYSQSQINLDTLNYANQKGAQGEVNLLQNVGSYKVKDFGEDFDNKLDTQLNNYINNQFNIWKKTDAEQIKLKQEKTKKTEDKKIEDDKDFGDKLYDTTIGNLGNIANFAINEAGQGADLLFHSLSLNKTNIEQGLAYQRVMAERYDSILKTPDLENKLKNDPYYKNGYGRSLVIQSLANKFVITNDNEKLLDTLGIKQNELNEYKNIQFIENPNIWENFTKQEKIDQSKSFAKKDSLVSIGYDSQNKKEIYLTPEQVVENSRYEQNLKDAIDSNSNLITGFLKATDFANDLSTASIQIKNKDFKENLDSNINNFNRVLFGNNFDGTGIVDNNFINKTKEKIQKDIKDKYNQDISNEDISKIFNNQDRTESSKSVKSNIDLTLNENIAGLATDFVSTLPLTSGAGAIVKGTSSIILPVISKVSSLPPVAAAVSAIGSKLGFISSISDNVYQAIGNSVLKSVPPSILSTISNATDNAVVQNIGKVAMYAINPFTNTNLSQIPARYVQAKFVNNLVEDLGESSIPVLNSIASSAVNTREGYYNTLKTIGNVVGETIVNAPLSKNINDFNNTDKFLAQVYTQFLDKKFVLDNKDKLEALRFGKDGSVVGNLVDGVIQTLSPMALSYIIGAGANKVAQNTNNIGAKSLLSVSGNYLSGSIYTALASNQFSELGKGDKATAISLYSHLEKIGDAAGDELADNLSKTYLGATKKEVANKTALEMTEAITSEEASKLLGISASKGNSKSSFSSYFQNLKINNPELAKSIAISYSAKMIGEGLAESTQNIAEVTLGNSSEDKDLKNLISSTLVAGLSGAIMGGFLKATGSGVSNISKAIGNINKNKNNKQFETPELSLKYINDNIETIAGNDINKSFDDMQSSLLVIEGEKNTVLSTLATFNDNNNVEFLLDANQKQILQNSFDSISDKLKSSKDPIFIKQVQEKIIELSDIIDSGFIPKDFDIVSIVTLPITEKVQGKQAYLNTISGNINYLINQNFVENAVIEYLKNTIQETIAIKPEEINININKPAFTRNLGEAEGQVSQIKVIEPIVKKQKTKKQKTKKQKSKKRFSLSQSEDILDIKYSQKTDEVLAPNRQPSILYQSLKENLDLTQEEIVEIISKTRTEDFNKWFGESLAVDENSEPLIFYHGSNKIFNEFDKTLGGSNTGAVDGKDYIYFTSSIDIAEGYSKMSRTDYENEPDDNYFLSLENEGKSIDNNQSTIYPVFLKTDTKTQFDFDGDSYSPEALKAVSNEDSSNEGFILYNIKDIAGNNINQITSTVVGVYNPNNIKSIYNAGSFQTDNNNIYQSISDSLDNENINSLNLKNVYDNDEIIKSKFDSFEAFETTVKFEYLSSKENGFLEKTIITINQGKTLGTQEATLFHELFHKYWTKLNQEEKTTIINNFKKLFPDSKKLSDKFGLQEYINQNSDLTEEELYDLLVEETLANQAGNVKNINAYKGRYNSFFSRIWQSISFLFQKLFNSERSVIKTITDKFYSDSGDYSKISVDDLKFSLSAGNKSLLNQYQKNATIEVQKSIEIEVLMAKLQKSLFKIVDGKRVSKFGLLAKEIADIEGIINFSNKYKVKIDDIANDDFKNKIEDVLRQSDIITQAINSKVEQYNDDVNDANLKIKKLDLLVYIDKLMKNQASASTNQQSTPSASTPSASTNQQSTPSASTNQQSTPSASTPSASTNQAIVDETNKIIEEIEKEFIKYEDLLKPDKLATINTFTSLINNASENIKQSTIYKVFTNILVSNPLKQAQMGLLKQIEGKTTFKPNIPNKGTQFSDDTMVSQQAYKNIGTNIAELLDKNITDSLFQIKETQISTNKNENGTKTTREINGYYENENNRLAVDFVGKYLLGKFGLSLSDIYTNIPQNLANKLIDNNYASQVQIDEVNGQSNTKMVFQYLRKILGSNVAEIKNESLDDNVFIQKLKKEINNPNNYSKKIDEVITDVINSQDTGLSDEENKQQSDEFKKIIIQLTYDYRTIGNDLETFNEDRSYYLVNNTEEKLEEDKDQRSNALHSKTREGGERYPDFLASLEIDVDIEPEFDSVVNNIFSNFQLLVNLKIEENENTQQIIYSNKEKYGLEYRANEVTSYLTKSFGQFKTYYTINNTKLITDINSTVGNLENRYQEQIQTIQPKYLFAIQNLTNIFLMQIENFIYSPSFDEYTGSSNSVFEDIKYIIDTLLSNSKFEYDDNPNQTKEEILQRKNKILDNLIKVFSDVRVNEKKDNQIFYNLTQRFFFETKRQANYNIKNQFNDVKTKVDGNNGETNLAFDFIINEISKLLEKGDDKEKAFFVKEFTNAFDSKNINELDIKQNISSLNSIIKEQNRLSAIVDYVDISAQESKNYVEKKKKEKRPDLSTPIFQENNSVDTVQKPAQETANVNNTVEKQEEIKRTNVQTSVNINVQNSENLTTAKVANENPGQVQDTEVKSLSNLSKVDLVFKEGVIYNENNINIEVQNETIRDNISQITGQNTNRTYGAFVTINGVESRIPFSENGVYSLTVENNILSILNATTGETTTFSADGVQLKQGKEIKNAGANITLSVVTVALISSIISQNISASAEEVKAFIPNKIQLKPLSTFVNKVEPTFFEKYVNISNVFGDMVSKMGLDRYLVTTSISDLSKILLTSTIITTIYHVRNQLYKNNGIDIKALESLQKKVINTLSSKVLSVENQLLPLVKYFKYQNSSNKQINKRDESALLKTINSVKQFFKFSASLTKSSLDSSENWGKSKVEYKKRYLEIVNEVITSAVPNTPTSEIIKESNKIIYKEIDKNKAFDGLAISIKILNGLDKNLVVDNTGTVIDFTYTKKNDRFESTGDLNNFEFVMMETREKLVKAGFSEEEIVSILQASSAKVDKQTYSSIDPAEFYQTMFKVYHDGYAYNRSNNTLNGTLIDYFNLNVDKTQKSYNKEHDKALGEISILLNTLLPLTFLIEDETKQNTSAKGNYYTTPGKKLVKPEFADIDNTLKQLLGNDYNSIIDLLGGLHQLSNSKYKKNGQDYTDILINKKNGATTNMLEETYKSGRYTELNNMVNSIGSLIANPGNVPVNNIFSKLLKDQAYKKDFVGKVTSLGYSLFEQIQKDTILTKDLEDRVNLSIIQFDQKEKEIKELISFNSLFDDQQENIRTFYSALNNIKSKIFESIKEDIKSGKLNFATNGQTNIAINVKIYLDGQEKKATDDLDSKIKDIDKDILNTKAKIANLNGAYPVVANEYDLIIKDLEKSKIEYQTTQTEIAIIYGDIYTNIIANISNTRTNSSQANYNQILTDELKKYSEFENPVSVDNAGNIFPRKISFTKQYIEKKIIDAKSELKILKELNNNSIKLYNEIKNDQNGEYANAYRRLELMDESADNVLTSKDYGTTLYNPRFNRFVSNKKFFQSYIANFVYNVYDISKGAFNTNKVVTDKLRNYVYNYHINNNNFKIGLIDGDKNYGISSFINSNNDIFTRSFKEDEIVNTSQTIASLDLLVSLDKISKNNSKTKLRVNLKPIASYLSSLNEQQGRDLLLEFLVFIDKYKYVEVKSSNDLIVSIQKQQNEIVFDDTAIPTDPRILLSKYKSRGISNFNSNYLIDSKESADQLIDLIAKFEIIQGSQNKLYQEYQGEKSFFVKQNDEYVFNKQNYDYETKTGINAINKVFANLPKVGERFSFDATMIKNNSVEEMKKLFGNKYNDKIKKLNDVFDDINNKPGELGIHHLNDFNITAGLIASKTYQAQKAVTISEGYNYINSKPEGAQNGISENTDAVSNALPQSTAILSIKADDVKDVDIKKQIELLDISENNNPNIVNESNISPSIVVSQKRFTDTFEHITKPGYDKFYGPSFEKTKIETFYKLSNIPIIKMFNQYSTFIQELGFIYENKVNREEIVNLFFANKTKNTISKKMQNEFDQAIFTKDIFLVSMLGSKGMVNLLETSPEELKIFNIQSKASSFISSMFKKNQYESINFTIGAELYNEIIDEYQYDFDKSKTDEEKVIIRHNLEFEIFTKALYSKRLSNKSNAQSKTVNVEFFVTKYVANKIKQNTQNYGLIEFESWAYNIAKSINKVDSYDYITTAIQGSLNIASGTFSSIQTITANLVAYLVSDITPSNAYFFVKSYFRSLLNPLLKVDSDVSDLLKPILIANMKANNNYDIPRYKKSLRRFFANNNNLKVSKIAESFFGSGIGAIDFVNDKVGISNIYSTLQDSVNNNKKFNNIKLDIIAKNLTSAYIQYLIQELKNKDPLFDSTAFLVNKRYLPYMESKNVLEQEINTLSGWYQSEESYYDKRNAFVTLQESDKYFNKLEDIELVNKINGAKALFLVIRATMYYVNILRLVTEVNSVYSELKANKESLDLIIEEIANDSNNAVLLSNKKKIESELEKLKELLLSFFLQVLSQFLLVSFLAKVIYSKVPDTMADNLKVFGILSINNYYADTINKEKIANEKEPIRLKEIQSNINSDKFFYLKQVLLDTNSKQYEDLQKRYYTNIASATNFEENIHQIDIGLANYAVGLVTGIVAQGFDLLGQPTIANAFDDFANSLKDQTFAKEIWIAQLKMTKDDIQNNLADKLLRARETKEKEIKKSVRLSSDNAEPEEKVAKGVGDLITTLLTAVNPFVGKLATDTKTKLFREGTLEDKSNISKEIGIEYNNEDNKYGGVFDNLASNKNSFYKNLFELVGNAITKNSPEKQIYGNIKNQSVEDINKEKSLDKLISNISGTAFDKGVISNMLDTLIDKNNKLADADTNIKREDIVKELNTLQKVQPKEFAQATSILGIGKSEMSNEDKIASMGQLKYKPDEKNKGVINVTEPKTELEKELNQINKSNASLLSSLGSTKFSSLESSNYTSSTKRLNDSGVKLFDSLSMTIDDIKKQKVDRPVLTETPNFVTAKSTFKINKAPKPKKIKMIKSKMIKAKIIKIKKIK